MRGRRPHIAETADGLARIPRPPAWLTPEAKAEWRRVAPELAKRRVLLTADLGALERYADAAGEVARCRKAITRDGDIIVGPRGTVLHPLHRVLQAAAAESRRLAAELGVTPAGRARQAPVEAEDDELLRLVR
jgi:P27 family predicted phage terminase small subunit